MATIITDKDILSAFHASDPRLWLREHVAGLTRRACYYYEAPISQSDDTIIRHMVLITHADPFAPTAHSKVEISSSDVTGGLSFSLFRREYDVEISPAEESVQRGTWSRLDDAMIKKAHDIAQAASDYRPEARSLS
ncbi:hypothetical protein SAMN04487939_103190 [Lysobacter sp. yr284]|uniref:hypothetical protein n=1 Tax=Lysobacter sp. yr284 TaxID=1761791 RepID=UPI00089A1F6E|nr:hypothetical protein [Lysobacter sp. yr284]SDY56092.1 hypothetical protein SAMN04487939_103190 [Lysobacter sp. yr284]